MVEELDLAVGRILDALGDRDALVLFASDNGGSVRHGADNAPLRYGKYGTYEGGIRVAAALRWPARLAGGSTFDGLASIEDVLPTVAAAAGADLPANIDGVDVVARIRGERPASREELFFAVRRSDCFRYALRRGSFKLVQEVPHASEPGPTVQELFDVALDPGEERDVASEHPELVEELARRIAAWREAGS
jgi:arylsulfatase A-like enzyme